MKKVKKLAPFILITALAGSILVGCSSKDDGGLLRKMAQKKRIQYCSIKVHQVQLTSLN